MPFSVESLAVPNQVVHCFIVLQTNTRRFLSNHKYTQVWPSGAMTRQYSAFLRDDAGCRSWICTLRELFANFSRETSQISYFFIFQVKLKAGITFVENFNSFPLQAAIAQVLQHQEDFLGWSFLSYCFKKNSCSVFPTIRV
jgi:hypothetical protein